MTLPQNKSVHEFVLRRREAIIGRSNRADICVPVESIALRHARIWKTGQEVWVEPLRSGLEVLIKRQDMPSSPITEKVIIRSGEHLILGAKPHQVLVELVADSASTVVVHQAEKLFSLEDDSPTPPPVLDRLLSDFAKALRQIHSHGEICQILTPVVKGLRAFDAFSPGNMNDRIGGSGLMLFGRSNEAPTYLMPPVLRSLIAGDGGVFSSAVQRKQVTHKLACGEVLKFRSEQNIEIVLVPIEPSGLTATGVWVIGNAPSEPLTSLQTIASAVSALLKSCLSRIRNLRELAILQDENRYFRWRERRHYLFKELVTESEPMKRIYEQVNQILSVHSPILIRGERGSGKEMVARALHHLSPRSANLMISQNCATRNETELDEELFGRVSTTDNQFTYPGKGLLEIAAGGTLFLESIHNLPLALQAKLLRAILEGEVRPEGESVGHSIDVQIVVSTDQDLYELVEEGSFRRDLHLLLATHTIDLPPLRERVADIVPLTRVFLSQLSDRYGKSLNRLDPELEKALCAYHWPGNVKELQGLIEMAVIRSEPSTTTLEKIPWLTIEPDR
jgi:transcriptional regulator with AAA-type ATPase domain